MSRTYLFTTSVILALLLTTNVQGQVCRVTVDGTNNGDGSDWATEAMDLHSALGDAACSEIWVKAGVYKPVTPLNPAAVTRAEREVSFRIDRALAVYGGFEGTETQLEQRDPDTHLTVLSGDIDGNDASDENGITQNAADISGANSFHVLWIDGGSVSGGITQTTRIDGLIVSGGLADDSSPWNPGGRGGGLYCDGEGGECSPMLSNMVFVGNRAYYSGGALYNRGVNGISSPILERVRLAGNHAGQIGGAIHNDARDGTSHPQLADIDFSSNHAAVAGGAVFNLGMFGSSSPQINGATFHNNSAGEKGGGMASHSLAGETAAQLTNVTFHANTAADGGAIFNHGRSSGSASPLLRNVTFNANSAGQAGGVIHNHASPGTLIEVDEAELQLDAGISTPSLVNVILWGNNADDLGSELFNDGATPTLRYSVVAGGCPADSDCSGGNIIEADPLLGPLQDNGGFTRTQLIDLAGSALDSGSAADCPATDQRGVLRPQGNGCDIGAFELVQPTTVTVVVSGQGLVNAEASPAPTSGGIVNCDAAGAGQAHCAAEYADGEIVTLNLTADQNWQLLTADGCDGELIGNGYTTSELNINCTANITFAINQYTLQYSADPGGYIDGDTPQTVDHGGNGSAVTAIANSGYQFEQWSDGSTDNPRTDTNVTADITVEAEFSQNSYTLTYTAGEGGSLTGDVLQTVLHGEDGTAVTAVPDPGFSFVQWSDNITDNPRIDENITEDLSVSAEFSLIVDKIFENRFELP
jgi:hypothetical protein